MGVAYYNCEICNEIFPDCGDFGWCGGCESRLCRHCYQEVREKNGILGDGHEKAEWFGEGAVNCCDACDGTVLDPDEFLCFVIAKTGLSKEELEAEHQAYKKSKGSDA